jgi:hypothetical protein
VYCTGRYKEEEKEEGYLHIKPIWKNEVWKMETGRMDYCGN